MRKGLHRSDRAQGSHSQLPGRPKVGAGRGGGLNHGARSKTIMRAPVPPVLRKLGLCIDCPP